MSDTKIFSLDGGMGSGGMAPLIASLCQNRGVDPNMLAALMNNNRNGFDGFGAWWIIILLIFGWGGFGNGFGGGFNGRGTAQGLADLGNLVNNDVGRDLIMQAIQGNATAISQLASTVHCDVNSLNSAIQNLNTQIGTLGLGQRDIIAAMQNGNSTIMSKLCDCCCENRLAVCQQTNTIQSAINTVNTGMERGFSETNYAFAEQTCQLKSEINALKQYVGEQFCALKERESQREIQSLRDQVQAFQLSASQQAQTANLVAQLRPCPAPAYVVPNPFGCNCNNNPYNNNGCGCYNNGCGC